MEAHNSTSGHLLLHWMRLLNSTYHSLLVVTTSVKLVYQLGLDLQMGSSFLMVTASGMARVVDPVVPVVPSTIRHGLCKQLPQTTINH